MNRRLVMAVLVLVACAGVAAGWFAAREHFRHSSVASSSPTVQHPALDCDQAPDDQWNTVRVFWYEPRKSLYTVASEICIGAFDIARQRVRVTDADFQRSLFQYKDDEIVRIENVDLLRNHVPELLVVTASAGTFDGLSFHVIGESGGRLLQWEVPDYDAAAEKLLRADEDFCCKDWGFHLEKDNVVLVRGIYRKGRDGNCCPSRGGIVVRLSPAKDTFTLANVQRISKPEYERWLAQPFCWRCVLSTPR